MKTLRVIFSAAALLASVLAACADDIKCAVCGEVITGRYYQVEDRVEGGISKICPVCEQIKERCYLCGLPVRENHLSLLDGRFICARDREGVVESEAEAKEICAEVKDGLDRVFSRFITMPGKNVELSIVDKYHLENLFHAPGYVTSCVSVYGATASNPLPGGKFFHTIDVLSYLPKSRLKAVCAHEYTHTWVAENLSAARRHVLDKNTHEAFCELVAYKYMESLHEDHEMEVIRRNTYTVGQIQVLLDADKVYGFNAIAEWMKNGEDSALDASSMERIRNLGGATPPPSQAQVAALLYTATPPPPLEPDKLTLKGISGSAQHRFALINGTTMEATEKRRVRVGQTNVVVRCLAIGVNSVVIEVGGSGEKKELFLQGKP